MKILKFGAEWCNPCKSVAPIIKEVAEARGIEIQEVDIDNDPEGLVGKYRIRGVPTIIVLEDDAVKSTLVGQFTKSQFEQFLECLK